MALAPLSSFLSFPPKKLCFFPSLRKLQEFHPSWIANPNLARRSLAPCCSSKKSSRERASKRNEELCDELREFISAMGLPENRVPSMKELCENGRKDLANIVRRRGYKAITELLLSSNGESHSDKTLEGNQDSIKANLYETAGDQEKNINVLPDRTFSSSNYSLEEDIIKSNGALLTMNDVQVCEDSEESLHLKATKFIQTGELDTIEGEDSELYQDLASKAHEQDNKNEINDLKILLDQREVELSQLKQQIEDEKIALSNLHDKGTAELRDMQRMIAEKDIELRAVEESLKGLKEVHITNWADGQIVEVAGSFNGWQHRVRMDPHPSSGYINPPGSRKSLLWTTVLWLYPGVYEIKFIVDGHWQIDSQREIITSGCITNNVLRVD